MTTFPKKNPRRIFRKRTKLLPKISEMPPIGNFTVTDNNIDLVSLGPDRYLKFDKYSHIIQKRLIEDIDIDIDTGIGILTNNVYLPPGALEILNKNKKI